MRWPRHSWHILGHSCPNSNTCITKSMHYVSHFGNKIRSQALCGSKCESLVHSKSFTMKQLSTQRAPLLELARHLPIQG